MHSYIFVFRNIFFTNFTRKSFSVSNRQFDFYDLFATLSLLVYLHYKSHVAKKLFIFSFTITYALAITSLINTLTTWIYYNVPTDGLPYKGYSILISFSISTLFLPLWILFYKKFFSSIEETLGANETGALSILSLLLFVALASGLSFIEYTSLFDNPMAFFLYFTLLGTILIIYFLYFKMYSSIHENIFPKTNI